MKKIALPVHISSNKLSQQKHLSILNIQKFHPFQYQHLLRSVMVAEMGKELLKIELHIIASIA